MISLCCIIFIRYLLIWANNLKELSKWLIIGTIIFWVVKIRFFYPLEEEVFIFRSWGGKDNLSFSLVILSLFMFVLIHLSRNKIVLNNIHYEGYYILLLILILVLVIGFEVKNFLIFYLFFEVSLVPTLFIIMGWGYQPERLQAGVYFIMYTIFASLPLLLGLIYLNEVGMSLVFLNIRGYLIIIFKINTRLLYFLIGVFICMAFLVKLPVYIGHLWLPRAHVEAPVAGSMILAGVLLKLGGYGLGRVNIYIHSVLKSIILFFFRISLLGMIYIVLVCCRLNDLKALVAYSSVAHMGLVICGFIRGLTWGFIGALIIIIAHGLSSSGLFCFVNLIYERLGSRSILLRRGVISLVPLFSLLLFMLCCRNISAPPSINLLSELLLIIRVNGFDIGAILVFPLGAFLGAVFTFYIFSYTHHGKSYFRVLGATRAFVGECHVILLHLIPINVLFLKNEIFFW